uniref:C-type lectin domain-containing protein n=1 Tax=Plectus sambesii TaxID=2011161 RepID=A0A914V4N4_9BILA
ITIGSQTVNLNALQVASIASESFLSGTLITGSKPFGAISGNTCGQSVGACDYEAVMLLPVGAWGMQFAAIPLMFLTTNYYQVVTNTDNTVVSAGGQQITTLNAGQYRTFQTGATIISSNNPILLVQIGQNVGSADNDLGDPFFLPLPSIDKMSNSSVLFQPTGFIEDDGVHFDFFIRIVTNLAGTETIQLDGRTLNALQFKHVPNSAIYYYEQAALNSTHSVKTTNPGTQFSVISYSYGKYEGCGFACAFSLPIENPAATTTPFPTTVATTVPTTPSTRCPANWSYLSVTNSCYQIFRQQVIWYVADEYCLSLNNGRHLTSIHSQAENDFIVNLAQRTLTIVDSQYTWIGVNDIANFNQFKWSDSTPYDFQNWGAGEPVQQQGAENCGVLTVSPQCSDDPAVGKWKDLPCGATNITSFVCKIPSL